MNVNASQHYQARADNEQPLSAQGMQLKKQLTDGRMKNADLPVEDPHMMNPLELKDENNSSSLRIQDATASMNNSS